MRGLRTPAIVAALYAAILFAATAPGQDRIKHSDSIVGIDRLARTIVLAEVLDIFEHRIGAVTRDGNAHPRGASRVDLRALPLHGQSTWRTRHA